MTAFFDDEEGDRVDSWSAGDPDAWKNGSVPNYDVDKDITHYRDNAILTEADLEREFELSDNHGFDILRPLMYEVLDLIDIIGDAVGKSPYFAHKELNVAMKRIVAIENSPYCKFAKDQNQILVELDYIRADVDTLKERAYNKLEWDV